MLNSIKPHTIILTFNEEIIVLRQLNCMSCLRYQNTTVATAMLYHMAYAHDIIILCPNIFHWLNEMLKIYHNFAKSNNTIFNNKKTVCIKFGKGIVKYIMTLINNSVFK